MTITATSAADSTKSVSATLTIASASSAPIAVTFYGTPPPSSMAPSASISISAKIANDPTPNPQVAWTATNGSGPSGSFSQYITFNVVAAPIPLTSLSEDAAALRRTIARMQEPVIVAGHAYAGAVVGTATDERVKALVYVAALASDEGETVADVFYRNESHPDAPQLVPDAEGFIWMPVGARWNADRAALRDTVRL